jgi:hypothetical protein
MTRNAVAAIMDTDSAMTASVTEILGHVADELRQAAALIDKTPVCTEHFMEGIGSQDSIYMRAMQGLDHSAQWLSGLADFLSALAESAPSHWHLDPHSASQVVTLAGLASRLRFRAEHPENGKAGATDGDCEFF